MAPVLTRMSSVTKWTRVELVSSVCKAIITLRSCSSVSRNLQAASTTVRTNALLAKLPSLTSLEDALLKDVSTSTKMVATNVNTHSHWQKIKLAKLQTAFHMGQMVAAAHAHQDMLFLNNLSVKFKIRTAYSTTLLAQHVLVVSKDIVWITEGDANTLMSIVLHLTLKVFA